MESDCCVPVGFRFYPTDEELVDYFLRNKVTAPPMMPDIIHEFDLFGDAEPWEIWELFQGPKLKDQDLYFFTNLKKNKKKKGSRRADRKVGLARLGTWSAGEASKLVYKQETGEPIGRKRKLRYENKVSEQHGQWYLDEYSLLVDAAHDSDCVICRLRMNDKSFLSCSGNKKRKNTSSSCQESSGVDDDREKGKKPRIHKKAKNVEQEEHESLMSGFELSCNSDRLLDIEKELMAMIDFDENQMATTIPPALLDHHQYPDEISQLVQPLQTDSRLAVDELVNFDDEGGQNLMGYNVNHDGVFDIEQELMAMLPPDDDHYLAKTQLQQLPLMPTDQSGNLGVDFGGEATTLQVEAAANIFDSIGNQPLLDSSHWSMSFFNDLIDH